jgi:hypothetical protein
MTAALLAGCGTASSSGSSTSTTSTTSTSANAFNPNLVPAAGTSAGASTKPKSKAAAKKTAKGKDSSTKTSKSPSSKSSVFTPPATTPAPTPAPTPSSPGATQTVTVSHTSTVTLTKYVHIRPNVPVGAGLPSSHKAASLSSFDAAGGNIGCRIQGGIARCDIAHRVWKPPHKPSSCHAAWAQGLMIGSSGSTSFVCGRTSVLDPTGYYIRPGYDDKVGSVTCQVRSFGVTCFQSDGHGFFVGRTGYTTF